MDVEWKDDVSLVKCYEWKPRNLYNFPVVLAYCVLHPLVNLYTSDLNSLFYIP